ncbi:MAG TPA: 2OG-Fe(II) oxygenase [Alphaproteobacteria bacterium]|jgi:PKHD-type hydroxylase
MFHFPIQTRPVIRPHPPNFVWGAGAFTDAELDKINAYAETLPAQQVKVGDDLQNRPDLNRSITRWLIPSAETQWIYQKIGTMVALLNMQHYKYDLTGFDEPLYHVTYPASQRGHYDWHADVSVDGQPMRKLSITFQMTDPAAYDGGDLEMNWTGTSQKCPRERGKLILFPSRQLHRVTPVTRGSRSALVAWVVGPPLR